jgi:hypothetical protein
MSMSNENIWRAMVATKQLEIDKLKRKIKEMEDDYKNRLGDIENRKKNKRSKPSDVSDK